MRGALGFEIFGNLVLGVWCFAVAVLFFRKKRAAPKAMIVLLVGNILFAIAEAALMSAPSVSGSVHAEAGVDIVKTFVISGIWIWYFAVSERVQGTFVR